VGWQGRDYAKWTDEERARIVGGRVSTQSTCPQADPRRRVELTALAIAVSVVASLGVSHFHLLRLGGPPAAPMQQPAPLAPIVYGTGLAHFQGSQEMTCTAMESDAQGAQSCTTWQYLQSGQRAMQAAPLPAGGPLCTAVVADQTTGSWKCTRGQLPGSGA
jgi:hypothetical protein